MSELLGTRRALLKGSPNRYEQDDEFRLPLAAGAVNGTDATSGPGTRHVPTDTGNNLSISGGAVVIAAAAAVDDPSFYIDVNGAGIATAIGRMSIFSILTPANSRNFAIGLSDDVTPSRADILGWYFAAGGSIALLITHAGVGAVTVGAWTGTTAYRLAVVIGNGRWYAFINETGNWIMQFVATGNVADPFYSSFAPVSAANPHNAEIDFIRIPANFWLPTPSYYDTFTRAPGVLGTSETLGPDGQPVSQRTWNGATWAVIAGNEARNTPGEGAELFTDGTLDTACGVNWACGAGWNIAAGVATSVAGAASSLTEDVTTAGSWYTFVWDLVARTAGSVSVRAGGVDGPAQTVPATYTHTVRAGGVSAGFRADAAFAGNVDNISVKENPLVDLFSSIAATAADVYIRVQVSALATGTQCGLVVRLDDATTPQNFVHLHFDGSGNVVLDEMAGGVYQATIMSVAQAYTADDWVELHLTGTAFRAYHRTAAGVPTLLGAGNVTVTGLLGTFCGGFSTNDGNTITTVETWAVGTGQEHARLNKWAKRLPQ